MISNKAVLLTGYEAFGEIKKNPSIEACKRLLGNKYNGYEIIVEEIPMKYQEVREIIEGHVEKYKPAAIICTGISSKRGFITVERVAINIGSAEGSTNFGYTQLDQSLNPDGPVGYFTTLPFRKILKAMTGNKIPAELSNTAGTYGCNQIFYHLMDFLTREKIDIPAGFIHVPRLPEQAIENGLPSMSLNLSVKALEIAVEVTTDELI